MIKKATKEPFSFLYIDKPRKFITKKFWWEIIIQCIIIMSYSNGLLNYNLDQSHLRGERGADWVSDGNYDMSNKKLENIADGTSDNSVVSKKWITDHFSTNAQDLTPYLKKNGSVQLTSNWNANKEIYVPDPTHVNSATRKAYVDYHINNQINGDREFHNNKITGLKEGFDDTDSINKKQLDNGLALKANTSELTNYVKRDGSVSMTGDLNMGNLIYLIQQTIMMQ